MFLSKKMLFFIEYVWLLVLLILACLFYLSQQGIGLFFNSDILLFPSFFKNIFLNSDHYRDWFLSPAPHFFPDMVLYLPTIFLSKQAYLQFLVYMCIIILLTYFIIKNIYQLYFSKKKSIFFSLTAVSTLFVVAFTLDSPYKLSFLPGAHYGQFLTGLLLIIISTKLLSNILSFKKNFLYFISSILIFLSSTSDLLFIIQFSIPFFLSYFLLYIKKYIKFSKFIQLSIMCILPAILGGKLSKYLVPHQVFSEYMAASMQKISLNTISIQITAFIKTIIIPIKYQAAYVLPVFYLCIFFLVGITVCTKKKIFLIKK